MPDWILILLTLLAVVMSGVAFAALAEVFRQLVELRTKLDADDEPMAVQVADVSLAGLVPDEVVERPSALLVFLHGRCGTCRLIAGTFAAGPPPGVWVVIPRQDAGTPAFAPLIGDERTILDDEPGGLADRLSLDVAPAVISVHAGEVTNALGISTVRQVTRLVASHLDDALVAA